MNWSWYWGPSYWYGHVPYFVYVPRYDCPPHQRWGYDRNVYTLPQAMMQRVAALLAAAS